jgi:hypothetical protein
VFAGRSEGPGVTTATVLALSGLVLWTAAVALALALCRTAARADRTVVITRRTAPRTALSEVPAPVMRARRARS